MSKLFLETLSNEKREEFITEANRLINHKLNETHLKLPEDVKLFGVISKCVYGLHCGYESADEYIFHMHNAGINTKSLVDIIEVKDNDVTDFIEDRIDHVLYINKQAISDESVSIDTLKANTKKYIECIRVTILLHSIKIGKETDINTLVDFINNNNEYFVSLNLNKYELQVENKRIILVDKKKQYLEEIDSMSKYLEYGCNKELKNCYKSMRANILNLDLDTFINNMNIYTDEILKHQKENNTKCKIQISNDSVFFLIKNINDKFETIKARLTSSARPNDILKLQDSFIKMIFFISKYAVDLDINRERMDKSKEFGYLINVWCEEITNPIAQAYLVNGKLQYFEGTTKDLINSIIDFNDKYHIIVQCNIKFQLGIKLGDIKHPENPIREDDVTDLLESTFEKIKMAYIPQTLLTFSIYPSCNQVLNLIKNVREGNATDLSMIGKFFITFPMCYNEYFVSLNLNKYELQVENKRIILVDKINKDTLSSEKEQKVSGRPRPVKGKLIVFEGLDYSFKETNSKALYEYIKKNVTDKVELYHFPQYDSQSSYFVKEYLKGNYKKDSNPFAIATMYALDRYDWCVKNNIKNKLDNGYYIICDRYVESNIIFQCVDSLYLNQWTGRKELNHKLPNKIYDLEYKTFKLPKPDITLYMDMPVSVSSILMKNRAKKNGEEVDIIEDDNEFMKKAEIVFNIISNDNKSVTISLFNAVNQIPMSKETIFGIILQRLKIKNII